MIANGRARGRACETKGVITPVMVRGADQFCPQETLTAAEALHPEALGPVRLLELSRAACRRFKLPHQHVHSASIVSRRARVDAAFSLGRRDGDGAVSADETFRHVQRIVEATRLPVSSRSRLS